MLEIPVIKIELVAPEFMPIRAHETDACYDCRAHIREPIVLQPNQPTRLMLGFKLQLPEGWVARLYSRSGLRMKNILHPVGTIDHLYREECSAVLFRNGGNAGSGAVAAWLNDSGFVIKPMDRICQLEFCRLDAHRLVIDHVEPSGRGGFGSTGIQEFNELDNKVTRILHATLPNVGLKSSSPPEPEGAASEGGRE